MAITVSMQPESGWIVYAGWDFLHPIQFCSSKEGLDYIMQNWPRSNLDGLVRFQPNTSVCKNHWAQLTAVLVECNWPATSFPLSDLVVFLHGWPRLYYAKPPWIQVGSGWLSGFGQTDPVRKQAGVQESLGLLLATALIQSGSDANQIQHILFTVYPHLRNFWLLISRHY